MISFLEGWEPRSHPLKPVGAAACGEAVSALRKRLISMSDEQLKQLRGGVADGVLILLGTETNLPWSPGIVYLGAEDSAARLLMPTALSPPVPAEWIERAVCKRIHRYPVAVLPQAGALISVSKARPISREVLLGFEDSKSQIIS